MIMLVIDLWANATAADPRGKTFLADMAHVSKTSKFQNTESKKSQPPVTFRNLCVSCVFRDIFLGGKNR